MAHLTRKGRWFVARFTYRGKEYKKSLKKTADRQDAEAALHDVESRLHALRRGLKQVPPLAEIEGILARQEIARA
jgi:hypothetical protein